MNEIHDALDELTVLASAFRKVLADGLIALHTDVRSDVHPSRADQPRVLVRTGWVDLTAAEARAIERAFTQALAD